jgi:hypothetical protein
MRQATSGITVSIHGNLPLAMGQLGKCLMLRLERTE